MKTYEFHPLADLFPPMSESQFEALVFDIQTQTQLTPILTYQGLIVDGRHRYSACCKLGIEPKFEEWNGDGTLLDRVISLNANRRHLEISDKIETALKLVGIGKGVNRYTTTQGNLTSKQVSKMLGISEDTIQRAKTVERDGIPLLKEAVAKYGFSLYEASKLAKNSPEEQDRLIKAGALLRKIKQVKNRADKEAERKAYINHPLPQGQYDIIVIDPPWQYTSKGNAFNETNQTTNGAYHYDTMTDEEIEGLDVNSLGKRNSILFLWVPSLKLPLAFSLLKKWDYSYISTNVWVKTIGDSDKLSHVPGQGSFIQTAEYLLYASKGKALERSIDPVRNVFMSVGGAGQVQHSAKPDLVYDTILKMWNNVKCLELFARKKRNGWTCWGNELE